MLAAHLDAMLALCETIDCRRSRLLAYFGQEGTGPCGNCDTCLEPPESWDATVPAQKLLSTVLRLERERGQKFGAGQAIDILLGRRTEKTTRFRHDELTVFGIGEDLNDAQWRGVVRQLLAQGLLAVEGEYGVLALTEESQPVLRGQHQVMMRREPERPARSAARSSGAKAKPEAGLSAEAEPVFERLRAWRTAAAKEQGVPPYVIFHDKTLRQIATDSPATLGALSQISGVGEAKLARYGEQIIETLAG
jgi:ATP-dependent DNA helicase RecQ